MGAITLLASIIVIFLCVKADISGAGTYTANETGVTLCINEVLYSNLGMYLDEDGDNSDYIELYNYGTEPVSFLGLSIADHVGGKDRWAFPDVTVEAGEYALVWASGKNKVTTAGEMHTDFMLSGHDTITLYDEKGDCIDELYVGDKVEVGVSVGRLPGEPEAVALLSNSSPGRRNNARAISFVEQVDKGIAAPVFSAESGVYQEEFELELSAEDGGIIFYTLDGSEPGRDSLVYKEPISIRDRSGEKGNISDVKTTPNYLMNYKWENTYAYKGTVVKARAMVDGKLSDTTVTKTYFVSPPTGMDIVALTVDPEQMFDEWDGLYVPGKTYYIWKKYNKESRNTVFPPANYYSSDKIKGHIEIFRDGLTQDNDVTVKVMGAASRSYAAKGLKITMDENKESFDGGLFELLPQLSEVSDEDMEQIVLRPGGSDFNRTMFADALAQSIVSEDMKVTHIGAQPSVLFINGEYWGIHNIREAYNADYFARHYGIDRKNLALITLNTGVEPYVPEIDAGTQADLDDYLELVEYVKSHDLSVSENYEYVCDRIDADSFIDYYIAQMYYGNDDWPGNNFRIWKGNQDGAEYGDGRWRPVFYDIDDAFLYPEFDTIEYVLNENYDEEILEGVNLHYNDNREIIEALIQNEDFKNRFFARFEECLDTVFAPETVTAQIDAFEELYAPEMESHFKRWHTADGWLKKLKNKIKFTYSEADLYTYDKWQQKVENMRAFAERRPAFLRECIDRYLSK